MLRIPRLANEEIEYYQWLYAALHTSVLITAEERLTEVEVEVLERLKETFTEVLARCPEYVELPSS